MSVTAAAVKLTLRKNKLWHFFQESIIVYNLRVCNWETTSPKKRYIALCIVYIGHE